MARFARARSGGARGGRLPRALGGRGASRPWRRCGRAGGRVGRGGVPASDVARGRSAAAHARPGREPRPRPGRAVVGARRPAAVRARAGGELHLPGGAARRADADARARVAAGPQRDRRAGRACRSRCCGRSVAGARRSRRRWRERGTSGPRAAEAAALATRQAKRGGVDDRLSSVAEWRARAAELGFDRGDLERLLGRVRAVELDAPVWERIFDELASPTGLDAAGVDVLAPRRHPGAVRAPPGRRAASTRARSRRRRIASSPRRMRSRCCPSAGRARRIGGATGGCCRSSATSSSTRRRSCSRSSSGSIDQVVESRGAGAGVAGERAVRGGGRGAADAVGRAASDGRAAVPGR